jgi:hypothetical protein
MWLKQDVWIWLVFGRSSGAQYLTLYCAIWNIYWKGLLSVLCVVERSGTGVVLLSAGLMDGVIGVKYCGCVVEPCGTEVVYCQLV